MESLVLVLGNVLFFALLRILNKIVPEKFDKLGLELLNVGIDSHIILKGIILLVSRNVRNRQQFNKYFKY